MSTVPELIAHEKSVDNIRKSIDADWLICQDFPDIYRAVNDAVI